MSFPLQRKHWSVRVAIMPGNIYTYFAQHGITVTETSLVSSEKARPIAFAYWLASLLAVLAGLGEWIERR